MEGIAADDVAPAYGNTLIQADVDCSRFQEWSAFIRILDGIPRPVEDRVVELVVLNHVAMRLVLDPDAGIVQDKAGALHEVVAGAVEEDGLGVLIAAVVPKGKVDEIDEIVVHVESLIET